MRLGFLVNIVRLVNSQLGNRNKGNFNTIDNNALDLHLTKT
jgi:hypothetical protein